MKDTLHTYHPTSDGSRGLHAFTTSNSDEALALASADELQRRLAALMLWSDTIREAVESAHGQGRVTAEISEAIDRAEELVSRTGGFAHA